MSWISDIRKKKQERAWAKKGTMSREEIFTHVEAARMLVASNVREISLGKLKVLPSDIKFSWSPTELSENKLTKLNGMEVQTNFMIETMRIGETRQHVAGYLDDTGNWCVLEMTLCRKDDQHPRGGTRSEVMLVNVTECSTRQVSAQTLVELTGTPPARLLFHLRNLMWGSEKSKKKVAESHKYLSLTLDCLSDEVIARKGHYA